MTPSHHVTGLRFERDVMVLTIDGQEQRFQTIRTAFATRCFTAEALHPYEQRWQTLLGEELALGLAFRKLYG